MSMWRATCTTRANRPASIVVLPRFELVSDHESGQQGQTPVRWHR